ncbi:MAG: PAS domain-containing sensor histidine kinase, partial [Bacteroidota bacterium]
GRTMAQEFGNGWAEGVHPDDFDQCLKTYVNSFDKKEAFYMEYRILNHAGEYRWLADFGRPFYDLDNSFIGYIGACFDITENKINQTNLIKLNATKDRFFSIIAHDLKSPFNSILGLSQLLQDQVKAKDYEQVDEMVTLIKQSSKRATDLLINLTDWAVTQSGKMQYNPQEFDLVHLSNEIEISLAAAAKLKNISIQKNMPSSVKTFADITMISTVMRNLLNNAIKFTHNDGVISITIHTLNADIIVAIKDNGIGMDNERIEKIFQFEEKITTPGTENEKGTGLGLIICKEFIEKNKGKFWVESQVRNGSTFYFSIPVHSHSA